MKKVFTLFFLLLCSFIANNAIAQREYQSAKFNTVKETNFFAISENVKKVLLEEKSKAVTPFEKKSIEKEIKQFASSKAKFAYT